MTDPIPLSHSWVFNEMMLEDALAAHFNIGSDLHELSRGLVRAFLFSEGARKLRVHATVIVTPPPKLVINAKVPADELWLDDGKTIRKFKLDDLDAKPKGER